MKKNLHMPFYSLANRGIHKETRKEFEESFFRDIYVQAESAVSLIVYENNRIMITNSEDNRLDLYKTPNLHNVIAFTGRRGTGKTTAMVNFANSLHYGEHLESKYRLDKNYFYAIPCIDAAMLNKNEDIFDVILSNMLLSLENEVGNHSYSQNIIRETNLREIKNNLFSVFNQHDSLKRRSSHH